MHKRHHALVSRVNRQNVVVQTHAHIDYFRRVEYHPTAQRVSSGGNDEQHIHDQQWQPV